MNTPPELISMIHDAWNIGKSFDLTGIGYGQIHWGNRTDVVKDPYSYYYFLAGIVHVTGARNIIEIGTHQGGSTLAISKGLRKPEQSVIVTIDVTKFGAQIFSGHPYIRAYQADANSEHAYKICSNTFTEVDLVYIDATHNFWPTLLNMQIYTTCFRPKYVVLDDITLNDEMQKLWGLICEHYGNNAVDVTEIIPEVRTPYIARPGFGLVRIPCTLAQGYTVEDNNNI